MILTLIRLAPEEGLKSTISEFTEWKEQDEKLSEFIISTHTIHGSSQFQKPSHSRWTWELLGGQFHYDSLQVAEERLPFNSRADMPAWNCRSCRRAGYIVPSVLTSEIRHAFTSMKNRVAPGPDRVRPERVRSLPPLIISTLAKLFTRAAVSPEVIFMNNNARPHRTSQVEPLLTQEVIQRMEGPARSPSLDTLEHV
ncbi:unnamed protein product [Haemonchus placei]|uniref:Uncharacterized protein n=1 Tax=Haemonchus placei TaxID=6290 RepID=A0A0N4W5R5_HAEPC|nr:unnamed protein product [Haemonchus placei]